MGAHRKAVMLEVLGVLAGRKRNWRWTEGVDRSKSVKNTSRNEEAGAFQVSADSMGLDQGPKDYSHATLGATDDRTFITGMKSNHKFAIEYTARLLKGHDPASRDDRASSYSRRAEESRCQRAQG